MHRPSTCIHNYFLTFLRLFRLFLVRFRVLRAPPDGLLGITLVERLSRGNTLNRFARVLSQKSGAFSAKPTNWNRYILGTWSTDLLTNRKRVWVGNNTSCSEAHSFVWELRVSGINSDTYGKIWPSGTVISHIHVLLPKWPATWRLIEVDKNGNMTSSSSSLICDAVW